MYSKYTGIGVYCGVFISTEIHTTSSLVKLAFSVNLHIDDVELISSASLCRAPDLFLAFITCKKLLPVFISKYQSNVYQTVLNQHLAVFNQILSLKVHGEGNLLMNLILTKLGSRAALKLPALSLV